MVLAGLDKGTKPMSLRCTPPLADDTHVLFVYQHGKYNISPHGGVALGHSQNNHVVMHIFILFFWTCFKCGVCYSGITPAHHALFAHRPWSPPSGWMPSHTSNQHPQIHLFIILSFIRRNGCRNGCNDYYSVVGTKCTAIFLYIVLFINMWCATIKIMKNVHLIPESKYIFV